MAKIAGILEILTDGEWHSVEKIREDMHLSQNQIQQIAGFLEQYEFVSKDETGKNIKIEAAVRKFLTEKSTS